MGTVTSNLRHTILYSFTMIFSSCQHFKMANLTNAVVDFEIFTIHTIKHI